VTPVGDELRLEAREAEEPAVDAYRLMSLPVTFRHHDDRLAEALRWHLAPFRLTERQRDSYDIRIVQTEEDRQDHPWRVTYWRGGERLFRGSPYRVLGYALWDVHALVYRDCRDFLFLHAGVVAGRRQRVVMPAEPGAGKSTLVASLLREGFRYLSDELAPIDPVTSGVYPFPKHVAVANRGLEHIVGGVPDLPEDYPALSRELPDRHVRPTDLGATVAEAGPVDVIVFLSADRQGAPTLREMSSAETIARLLDNTLNTELYGDRAVKMVARVVRSAGSFELTGGSSADRAAVLREHVS
jgi:hypothetical protein